MQRHPLLLNCSVGFDPTTLSACQPIGEVVLDPGQVHFVQEHKVSVCLGLLDGIAMCLVCPQDQVQRLGRFVLLGDGVNEPKD